MLQAMRPDRRGRIADQLRGHHAGKARDLGRRPGVASLDKADDVRPVAGPVVGLVDDLIQAPEHELRPDQQRHADAQASGRDGGPSGEPFEVADDHAGGLIERPPEREPLEQAAAVGLGRRRAHGDGRAEPGRLPHRQQRAGDGGADRDRRGHGQGRP